MDCWFYIPPKHFRDDVSTCNQKDKRVNCHCPDAAYGCCNDFLDAGSELRGLETTSTHPGYLQCHVPTCANYITGAGMIQLTLTLIPVPILVICFSWGSVQSLHVLRCYGKRERLESKFCRHSGEFKMPCAGPPNMWRNSGYRRMETKMGPKT